MALTQAEASKLSQDIRLTGVVETVIQESPVLRVLPFIQVAGNGLVYDQSLEALDEDMGEFGRHYHYQRCDEALGNVTPADAYYGRRDAILARREEVKRESLEIRRAANLGTT